MVNLNPGIFSDEELDELEDQIAAEKKRRNSIKNSRLSTGHFSTMCIRTAQFSSMSATEQTSFEESASVTKIVLFCTTSNRQGDAKASLLLRN